MYQETKPYGKFKGKKTFSAITNVNTLCFTYEVEGIKNTFSAIMNVYTLLYAFLKTVFCTRKKEIPSRASRTSDYPACKFAFVFVFEQLGKQERTNQKASWLLSYDVQSMKPFKTS